MKQYLSILLSFFATTGFISAFEQVALEDIDFSDKTLVIPVQDAFVMRDDTGYFVHDGNKAVEISNHDISKSLASMDKETLARFIAAGNTLKLSKLNNGEYTLDSYGRVRGGGPAGATVGFYAGKFLTHFVCHGAIQIAAVCSGPAYLVTLASLEATFAPTIEAASNVVACGTGMIGAVATGPA